VEELLILDLSRFDGAISVETLPRPPNRQFEFHGFMRPSLGIYKKLIEGGKKPPTHFHPHQWEFFRVIQGNLTIDLNGHPKHVTSQDGEIVVAPCTHHVIYGTPGTEDNEVEFVVSASDARGAEGVVLDQAFFENWYGYQEDIFQRGVKLDLIQVLSVRFVSSQQQSMLGPY
jgi:mannose-6-phosphate isomerase-like protein (cupin superfamily)